MYKFAGPVPPGSSDLLSMRQTRGPSTQIGCQAERAPDERHYSPYQWRAFTTTTLQINEIKLVSLSDHLHYINVITYTIKIK